MSVKDVTDSPKAPLAVGCDALVGDFSPSLRNTHGNTWEASITLPVVGTVTTNGNGWPEAKMRLWLISEAVKMIQAKPCKDPKDWTESEWRATMKTMRDVMSPNKKFSGETSAATTVKNL